MAVFNLCSRKSRFPGSKNDRRSFVDSQHAVDLAGRAGRAALAARSVHSRSMARRIVLSRAVGGALLARCADDPATFRARRTTRVAARFALGVDHPVKLVLRNGTALPVVAVVRDE